MLKSTMTAVIVVALAGGLFAPDAQARGVGGRSGKHDRAQVNGLHEMRAIDLARLHDNHKSCQPNCSGLLGCRGLWQYYCL
jgi:hypothetical protein